MVNGFRYIQPVEASGAGEMPVVAVEAAVHRTASIVLMGAEMAVVEVAE